MERWSDLHPDIFSLIINKIKNPSDHIRCSSVCSSWRSVSLRHRYTLPHTIPGLITVSRNSLSLKFLNFKPNSPPFDHRDLDISCLDTCLGSYQGWLVLSKDDHTNSTTICYLYNPFLKKTHLLPSVNNNNNKVYKAVLSNSPSYDENCVVLILFESKGVAICRLKDDSWKNLSCNGDNNFLGFSDGILFQGRFYVVDDYGKIYTCNVNETILQEIEYQPSDVSSMVRYKWYLVEVQGELFRVLRKFSVDEHFYYECYDNVDDDKVCCSPSTVSTREFRVLRFDSRLNEWVLVRDLGKYALFIGYGNSVCLSETDFGGRIRGNTVYFTDDRQKNCKHFGVDNPGKDMGVYDMMDMSIEPLYSDPWYEFRGDMGAIWVTPLPW